MSTVGSWLTDKVYAKSGDAEINGYDPDSGAKLWTIKLPGPVCTASHTTDSGRTAIVDEPAMPTKAQAFPPRLQRVPPDLAAGKPPDKSVRSGSQSAADTSPPPRQHRRRGQHQRWRRVRHLHRQGAVGTQAHGQLLYDAGYGGGDKRLAVRKCGEYGSTRQLHIQTIDPTSGKVISEYKMSPGIEYASVVSTNPLVVAADVGDSAGDGSGISDFFSIDNKTGQLRTRISAPGKTYAAKCDGITRIEGCAKLVVGNDRLYIPTEQHADGGQSVRINEIVPAFDLGTGKQTGQRADAGDGYDISPLRMDGGNLLAYKRPPYEQAVEIVSIDGTSFKETKLLENPATQAVRDAETSMLRTTPRSFTAKVTCTCPRSTPTSRTAPPRRSTWRSRSARSRSTSFKTMAPSLSSGTGPFAYPSSLPNARNFDIPGHFSPVGEAQRRTSV